MCCYYNNPTRWEAYNTLLTSECTKTGELVLEMPDKKNEQVKLCQKEEYLYILTLDLTRIICIFS